MATGFLECEHSGLCRRAQVGRWGTSDVTSHVPPRSPCATPTPHPSTAPVPAAGQCYPCCHDISDWHRNLSQCNDIMTTISPMSTPSAPRNLPQDLVIRVISVITTIMCGWGGQLRIPGHSPNRVIWYQRRQRFLKSLSSLCFDLRHQGHHKYWIFVVLLQKNLHCQGGLEALQKLQLLSWLSSAGDK